MTVPMLAKPDSSPEASVNDLVGMPVLKKPDVSLPLFLFVQKERVSPQNPFPAFSHISPAA